MELSPQIPEQRHRFSENARITRCGVKLELFISDCGYISDHVASDSTVDLVLISSALLNAIQASPLLLSSDDQLPSELERSTANNASVASLAVNLEVRTSYVPASFKTDFDGELQELGGEVKDILVRLAAHNAIAGGQQPTGSASMAATV